MSTLATPLERAITKNSAVSHLESPLTKSFDLHSPEISTYRKRVGGPAVLFRKLCRRPVTRAFPAKTPGCFSGILLRVRSRLFPATLVILAAGLGIGAQQPPPPQQPSAPGAGAPGQQTPTPTAPQAPTPTAPQLPPAPTKPTLSVVVLDPGHGGTDAGARGLTGVLEKDAVLDFARMMRSELERQGLRVVVTRQGDENPSFDDRAAVANAQRGAIFLSLHVSSIGPVGTAHAYYLRSTGFATTGAAAGPSAERAAPTSRGTGLLRWDQAQEPYLDLSRRLAELVQVELGRKFRGSPEVPAASAVRPLRSVAAPAIAVEVSSVSVPDRKPLEQMGPGLADAVARAVAAFRSLYDAGAH